MWKPGRKKLTEKSNLKGKQSIQRKTNIQTNTTNIRQKDKGKSITFVEKEESAIFLKGGEHIQRTKGALGIQNVTA